MRRRELEAAKPDAEHLEELKKLEKEAAKLPKGEGKR